MEKYVGILKNCVTSSLISMSLIFMAGLAHGQQEQALDKDKAAEEYLHHVFGTRPGVNADWVKGKWLDVPYAALSSAEKLDIYLPPEGQGPFPVIAAIHGGSFSRGDKGDFQIVPMLQALKRGYAVASVNYRLSGEAQFPSQINDVKAAIRFLRANAGKYGLNPDKVAVWGDSAGGYLAALAGTTQGMGVLEDLSLGNPTQSSRVNAVVDWYGPIDFLKLGHIKRLAQVGEKMIGQTSAEAPELYARANPQTYISAGNPPFYIQHGQADQVIPVAQSLDFAAKLIAALGQDKVRLDVIDGADHLDEKFTTPDNINKILDFLDKYMK